MPEGPEVRTVVDQLQAGVGMHFHGVTFLSGRYVRHGPPDGYDDFAKTLDKEVDILREWNAKGKFIYIVLNDGNQKSRGNDFKRSIWITLGMSGRFVAETMNSQQLTEPRWTFTLAGQGGKPVNIFYHDPRNFGTLKFSLSARALDDKLLTLGPDILHPDTTTEDVFVQIVAAQKSDLNICKFLMNQKKISGIGNYILAEGLYRAKIDPFCSLHEIPEESQRILFRELQSTALQSYQVQGLTRPGGSYRDAEGNKGRFEFQLQCYGRTVCAKGTPVQKEIKGPHGRTIWYTEDQLFMPRAMRLSVVGGDDDNEEETRPELLSSEAVQPGTTSQTTKTDLNKEMATPARQDGSVGSGESSQIQHTLDGCDPVERLLTGLKDDGWKTALDDTIKSEEFRNLAFFVANERSRGVVVYPPEDEVFAALNLCPLDGVKVVIVGQDPYHGPGQGHGLSFSVRPGVSPPPSLQNIIKEAQRDVGIDFPVDGHLACWAAQGVLLLNAVLTVRMGEANSHAQQGWEFFTDAVIKTLNDEKDGIVFLLWGKAAQLKASSVEETRHTVIRTSHPSPLGATKTDSPFLGSRCFSRTNKILEAAGKTPINWNLR